MQIQELHYKKKPSVDELNHLAFSQGKVVFVNKDLFGGYIVSFCSYPDAKNLTSS